MADSSPTIRAAESAESVATFEWRNLHLHVVTWEPLSADQVNLIERMLPKIKSVGQFADVVGMLLGRHVKVVAERPSTDVRLEVGR
jgi:muramoyltetrapeptide carboxypeptidase LdcA involved in peptidoglycan recycling